MNVGNRLLFGLCTLVLCVTNAASGANWSPFDFESAWGFPEDVEKTFVSVTADEGRNAPSDGQCGVFNCVVYADAITGTGSPTPDIAGILDVALKIEVPEDLMPEPIDAATLTIQGIPAGLEGAIYFRRSLFAGTLATPTGYAMPVTGAVATMTFLNEIDGAEDELYEVASVYVHRQWSTLDDAIADTQAFGDNLWDPYGFILTPDELLQSVTPISGVSNDGPVPALPSDSDGEPDFTPHPALEPCYEQLEDDFDACIDAFLDSTREAKDKARLAVEEARENFRLAMEAYSDFEERVNNAQSNGYVGGVIGGVLGGVVGGVIGTCLGGPFGIIPGIIGGVKFGLAGAGGVGAGAAIVVGAGSMFITPEARRDEIWRELNSAIYLAQYEYFLDISSARSQLNGCLAQMHDDFDDCVERLKPKSPLEQELEELEEEWNMQQLQTVPPFLVIE